MPDFVTLRAAFGQRQAGHGATSYRVDGGGRVRVPREAVPFLVAKGGFVVDEPAPPARPGGMVRLHHDAARACSWGGRAYPADEAGNVLVPAEAAGDLAGHAFTRAPALAAAPRPVLRASKASRWPSAI